MNTTRISIFNVFGILAIAAAAVSCAFAEPEDIPLVKLGAIEKEYVVEAEASTFDIDIYTNGPYHIEYIEELIKYGVNLNVRLPDNYTNNCINNISRSLIYARRK